mmetsp:Transcript_12658/g.28847  ORF Transcript_12658/g.28847 Transcript_12658/m.28847 type:complete len:235 (-) Transcript_12658:450-1154(-)
MPPRGRFPACHLLAFPWTRAASGAASCAASGAARGAASGAASTWCCKWCSKWCSKWCCEWCTLLAVDLATAPSVPLASPLTPGLGVFLVDANRLVSRHEHALRMRRLGLHPSPPSSSPACSLDAVGPTCTFVPTHSRTTPCLRAERSRAIDCASHSPHLVHPFGLEGQIVALCLQAFGRRVSSVHWTHVAHLASFIAGSRLRKDFEAEATCIQGTGLQGLIELLIKPFSEESLR